VGTRKGTTLGRIKNTISLAKASWQVLLSDKELMLLPVMSTIASIIIAATFFLPIVLSETEGGPVVYAISLLVYFLLSFVVIYFNTALVAAAYERLAGGDPTLGSALAEANRHLPVILGWSAVSATVSMILKQLEERAGIIGAIVGRIAGLAWTLVTFLVIPVFVIEGLGVMDSIKRSAEIFKSTWGENMAANVGFGILGFLAMLPLILLVFLGAAAGSGAVLGVTVGLAVLGAILISVTMATLSGIFQTALYMYATMGEVPGPFVGTNLAGAFRPKRRGLR